jgi:DNA-directed RNA polymerase subunit RPC12/RpoP
VAITFVVTPHNPRFISGDEIRCARCGFVENLLSTQNSGGCDYILTWWVAGTHYADCQNCGYHMVVEARAAGRLIEFHSWPMFGR